MTGHDPETGRELWRADGLNPDNNPYHRIVASPVAAGELVVAPTRVKPMLVLKAFGNGDVTKSAVVWSFDRGPDVPTPATDGTLLYVLTDKGLLYCMDLATGKPHYGPERLRTGTYSSSPLLADGKLYVTSEDGVTSVVKAGHRLRAPGRERARRLHRQLPRRGLGPALHPHRQPPLRHRPGPLKLICRTTTRS